MSHWKGFVMLLLVGMFAVQAEAQTAGVGAMKKAVLPLPFPACANPVRPLLSLAQFNPLPSNYPQWFDPKAYYACTLTACGIAAVVSFLFLNPAIVAGGCTLAMLTCAAQQLLSGGNATPRFNGKDSLAQ